MKMCIVVNYINYNLAEFQPLPELIEASNFYLEMYCKNQIDKI